MLEREDAKRYSIGRTSVAPLTSALLALVAMVMLSHSASAETWWAEKNSEHEGCGAHQIWTSAVEALSSPPYWQGDHTYWWQVPASDWDCYQSCPDAPYSDHEENKFECTWRVMVYDDENDEWQQSGEPTVGDTTYEFQTGGYSAGYYHLRASDIDDTPGDLAGPGGDDTPVVEEVSAGWQVTYPYIVNWQRTWSKEHPDEPGYLLTLYEWESSCGHTADLDDCSGREYVDYPGEPDPSWPYYEWPEPGSDPLKPWMDISEDPTTKGFTPAQGGCFDEQQHGDFYPQSIIGAGAGFTASQSFQQRTNDMPGDDWIGIAYYLIDRDVFKDEADGKWKYTCTKDGKSIPPYTIPERPE